MVPDYMCAVTTAVTNMVLMFFGYVFHTTISIVINHYTKSGGEYEASVLRGSMSVILVGIILGMVGMFFVKIHNSSQTKLSGKKIHTI